MPCPQPEPPLACTCVARGLCRQSSDTRQARVGAVHARLWRRHGLHGLHGLRARLPRRTRSANARSLCVEHGYIGFRPVGALVGGLCAVFLRRRDTCSGSVQVTIRAIDQLWTARSSLHDKLSPQRLRVTTRVALVLGPVEGRRLRRGTAGDPNGPVQRVLGTLECGLRAEFLRTGTKAFRLPRRFSARFQRAQNGAGTVRRAPNPNRASHFSIVRLNSAISLL